jgi:hypothetical protein
VSKMTARETESVRYGWKKPALKRLASAVQLRPWPPHFKGFNTHSDFPYYRQFTGSCCSYSTEPLSISSCLLWLKRSSRNIPWAFSLSSDIDLA